MRKQRKIVILVLFILIFSCSGLTHKSFSQWLPCNQITGSSTNCFDTIDSKIFCGTSSDIFISTNNGLDWTNISIYSAEALTHNETYLFAGEWGGVYRTSNNGLNWETVNSGLPNIHVSSLIYYDSNLFAGIRDSGVFRSTNNGDNWIRANSGLNVVYITSFSLCGSYMFAGTSNGIYRTSNNGQSWQDLNFNNIIASLAANDTRLYAGTREGKLYVTSNYGNNWTLLFDQLPSFDVHVTTYENYIFAGLWDDFYVSTNNGVTWINNDQGLSGFATSVFAFNNFAYFGASGHPLLFRRSISELVGISNTSNVLPEKFLLYQNYPNPFNSQTTIEFDIKKKGDYSLVIYDCLGRKRDEVFNEYLNAGSYSVSFNGDELQSGVYFYRLSADGNVVETRKMLLIK